MAKMTMRAIRVHEYGGPEKLALETVERPEPSGNKVLVRLKAAGVNPVDWKLRSGMIKDWMPLSFPWAPGIDGAGVVEAVGPDVKGFAPGDHVFGVFSGSYAEMALAPEGDLCKKPKNLSFEQAAAVPVGALTAWNGVIEDGAIQAGQHILVLGASGGVGVFAVQFAHWKKARVTGTTSAANAGFVMSIGADEVVDYQKDPVEQRIGGVDVLFDTVGGEALERALKSMKKGGAALSVAGQVSEQAAKEYGIRAIHTGRAPSDRLHQIAALLESGAIQACVAKVFPLADAAAAHKLSESRHGRGRIVLHIAD